MAHTDQIQQQAWRNGFGARLLALALLAALALCGLLASGSTSTAVAAKAPAAKAKSQCAKLASRSARRQCQQRSVRRHPAADAGTRVDIGSAQSRPAPTTSPASQSTTTPTPPAPPAAAPKPPVQPTADCSDGADLEAGLGSFSAENLPDSCWRPYHEDSSFNTPVAGKATAAGSAQKISRLLSGGALSYFVAGDKAKDYGTAVYYPTSSDPVYTIDCVEPWGRCALEGLQIHLPDGAAPSGTWPIGDGDIDSHLTVVDQESGWEYDLWNVRTIANGKITIKWGGKTRIDGDGLNSDAVAARFGSLAGIIRPSELSEGHIDHALVLTIPCTVGFVAPATKGGLECSEAGMSSTGAMAMGAHLQLQMSPSEIAALHLPAWKQAIIEAFATYGAYVEDTTGDSSQWGLKWESPASTTSFGGADGYVALAESLGMEPQDYNGNGEEEYWFNLASGIDWSKLRVVS